MYSRIMNICCVILMCLLVDLHVCGHWCILSILFLCCSYLCVFFFNDTATPEIYTSLFVGSVRCVYERALSLSLSLSLSVSLYLSLSLSLARSSALCLSSALYVSLPIYIYIYIYISVSYTHLRAHETVLDLVCRFLLEKKNK